MTTKFLPLTFNFLSVLSLVTVFYCQASSATITVSQREEREPEAATGYHAKQAVVGSNYMVAAANPYASQAGLNILQQGGSAVDAAIAVQMVLNLVEPQSSGIGGGAFILHWHQQQQKITTFDGREMAPALANAKMFLDDDGHAIPWLKAVVGGRSVGVPGVLNALAMAHKKYGKLAWASLFEEAIRLAEQGFVVSPRLAELVALELNPGMVQLKEIHQYFYPDGQAIKAGTILKNPLLAQVLRAIAKDGIKPFYQGWIAEKIVSAVQHAKIAPGKLQLADMTNYQAIEREPVCGSYHQYQVCGMAPPSSGGIAVLQILQQLEPFHLAKRQPNGLSFLHLFAESSRLAFADRAKYVADADFVPVPIAGLLDKQYLHQRAKLIDQAHASQNVVAGTPNGALVLADDDAYELPSTSHISIVDASGNAISMTTSIEMAFGSALMVQGFILNNQLTDFSLSPNINGIDVANKIEPFKRPRSSMSPMMVFNADRSLKLVVGSPGGSRIIDYVAQTIIGVLDWHLDPQQAINLPKLTNRNDETTLERGTPIAQFQPALHDMGHKVAIRDLNSGVHAIAINAGKLVGGADPRREGKVLAH